MTTDFIYEEIKKRATLDQPADLSLKASEHLRFIFDHCINGDTLADELVIAIYQNDGYRSLETKMFEGNGKGNGFDGLFIKDNIKVLVEVKFDNRKDTTSPKPGKLNINGINWRQLSTPYNKKILKEMSLHPNLKEAYDLIKHSQESIQLLFVVLNGRNLTLDWYDAGTFLQSKLN